jgi:hypothetical protein
MVRQTAKLDAADRDCLYPIHKRQFRNELSKTNLRSGYDAAVIKAMLTLDQSVAEIT